MICSETKVDVEASDMLITQDEGRRIQTVCDVNGRQLMLLGAKQHAQLEVHVLQVLGAGSGLQGRGGGVIVWRTAQERVTCDV